MSFNLDLELVVVPQTIVRLIPGCLKVDCQLHESGTNLGEDDRVELLKVSFTGDTVLGASTAPTIGTAVRATTSTPSLAATCMHPGITVGHDRPSQEVPDLATHQTLSDKLEQPPTDT
jgi:hypothetical protein